MCEIVAVLRQEPNAERIDEIEKEIVKITASMNDMNKMLAEGNTNVPGNQQTAL